MPDSMEGEDRPKTVVGIAILDHKVYIEFTDKEMA